MGSRVQLRADPAAGRRVRGLVLVAVLRERRSGCMESTSQLARRRAIFRAMQLEDHAGDIVGKARAGAGLSVGEAAAAAGLPVDRYEAFESEGRPVGALDYGALAQRLGLHPGRLQAIVAGWHPRETDFSRWRELRRITTSHGMAVHCYVVWDEVTREAALFDTGWEAQPIVALLTGESLELRHVFITHSHPDHIAAIAEIRERYPRAKVHTSSAHAPVDQRNRVNDFIHLGSLRITHRPTPGHAEDGVTYLVGTWPEDAPTVAMVGDALFAGSMGGAAGRLAAARERVREQILSLPPDTLVCPGHGPATTVGEERSHNPFFG